MCKDYDPPTVYQNAFKMEEEGHSLCTLKKKPKVGTDQGGVDSMRFSTALFIK